MGKAARIRRERAESIEHEQAPRVGPRLPIFWLVVLGLVAAGVVALVVSRPDATTRARERAAAKVPAYATVEVVGRELPNWSGSGKDPAVGRAVPRLQGTTIAGRHVDWASADGVARAYVVFAHWCPHCQVEVPRIVTWARTHELPAGVEVVGVSTSTSRNQPNFPPAAWLDREHWSWPALIDDEAGTAAQALGVEGFPFLVFVDARGVVVSRFSGEMPIGEFGAAIRTLAPKG